MMRAFFIALSHSKTIQRLTARFGPARRISRRFIAGETLDDACAVVRNLNESGLMTTLNHLGESVNSIEDAKRAAAEYVKILSRIHEDGLKSTISVKPTHLGLTFGGDVLRENLETILRKADALELGVEMDIENSPTTDTTLDVFRSLLEDHKNFRLALQAYLFRTEDDLKSLIALGSSARLVKGAYNEPPDVAWRKKADVDTNFARLIETVFSAEARSKGFYPALGTHDHHLIDKARELVSREGIDRERFEIQMIYGIRRDWQRLLAKEGYRVRIYVPFGIQWYPYFMRRLAERPANVLFMARAMLGK